MSKSSAKLMTEGSIWKRIVAFAIPLFWGNLFQQLYNTADSLIVGMLPISLAMIPERVVFPSPGGP